MGKGMDLVEDGADEVGGAAGKVEECFVMYDGLDIIVCLELRSGQN